MAFDILQMVILLVVLFVLVRPTGRYMAAVYTNGRTWLDVVFDPVDNAIYRISGVDPREQQRWPAYVKAMLITNAVMFGLLFVILETQQFLPLNPDGQGPINPWLAFNTAMSFVTNTNWQNYGGESTLSYFTQMFAIIFPQFTSAATGLACGVAFIRGLGGSVPLGNFYVDLTRTITRILLPIAFVTGIAFVALGVPATFDGSLQVNTLNGPLTASTAPCQPRRGADAGADAFGNIPGPAERSRADRWLPGLDQTPGHQRRRLVQRQLGPPVRKSQPDQQRARKRAHGPAAHGADLHARHHDQPHEAGVDALLGDGRLLPGVSGDRVRRRDARQSAPERARAEPGAGQPGGP